MPSTWDFYPNNVWNAGTAIGTINQAHEADWERVIVGVGVADEPTFVGYSSHCAGVWRPWNKVPVISKTDDVLLQQRDRVPGTSEAWP